MRIKPTVSWDRYLENVRYCDLCSAQNYARRAGMLQSIIEYQLREHVISAWAAIEASKLKATSRLSLAHDQIKRASETIAKTIALLGAADRERDLNRGRFA